MSRATESDAAQGQILVLSSDQSVYAFDLWETFRIAIGRHDSNDIPLDSRKVSNYHAEILNEVDGLLLRDLGSTNGTYVNGEKVKQQRIKEGDRLRIGGYDIVVHLKPREEGATSREATGRFDVGASGKLMPLRPDPKVNGVSLAPAGKRDVRLGDLLRLLSRNQRSVIVLIRGQSDRGRIFVEQGRVVHAEIGKIGAAKALYRMLQWQEAAYEVMALPGSLPVAHSINLPTDTLISEGTREAEELDGVTAALPPPTVPVRLKEDCTVRLCDLSPAEIEIFQDLIRHETIARVLEESPLTDCRVLSVVHALLQKKVFAVASSGTLLDETFVSRP